MEIEESENSENFDSYIKNYLVELSTSDEWPKDV